MRQSSHFKYSRMKQKDCDLYRLASIKCLCFTPAMGFVHTNVQSNQRTPACTWLRSSPLGSVLGVLSVGLFKYPHLSSQADCRNGFFIISEREGKVVRTTQLIRKDVYSNMKLGISSWGCLSSPKKKYPCLYFRIIYLFICT